METVLGKPERVRFLIGVMLQIGDECLRKRDY